MSDLPTTETLGGDIEPQKHPAFYFHDGDVALSACNHDGTTSIFRVHKFVLSHHSPVFSDMFALPQTTDSTEKYDNVVLVHMPDAALDVETMLQILYDPSTSLPFSRNDPNTPILLTGPLKVATKYQMNPLRQRMLDHFAADWPQTVLEWEIQEGRKKKYKDLHVAAPGCMVDGKYWEDRFPEPAAAIRMAMDFSCHHILPAAFYELSTLSINSCSDWDHVRSLSTDSTHRFSLLQGNRAVRWSLLDKDDLFRLMKCSERLRLVFDGCRRHLLLSWPGSRLCTSEESCKASRRAYFLAEETRPRAPRTDPLGWLDRLSQGANEQLELCVRCQPEIQSRIRSTKESVWAGMLRWLGLEHL